MKKLTFIIKTIIKLVTLFSEYEKSWNAFRAVKKIIVYFKNKWFLLTANIIWEKENKRLEYYYRDKTMFR